MTWQFAEREFKIEEEKSLFFSFFLNANSSYTLFFNVYQSDIGTVANFDLNLEAASEMSEFIGLGF